MKKFIAKIFATSDKSAAKEKVQDKNSIEAIIKDFDMPPFAISEENVLFAGFNELGGFFFLQTVIVGSFKIKTKKGIGLAILGKDTNLDLSSDMLELESDGTDVSNRYISKIDFQLEESDMQKISSKTIDKLILQNKKDAIEFQIFRGNKTVE